MKSNNELVFLESDGPICKYLCTKDNTIVMAEGAIKIPGIRRTAKYKGIVTWSLDTPLIKQINDMHKICIKYFSVSNKEILDKAREDTSWTFGEFFDYEAIDILNLSKKYNLCIEMVDVDSGIKLTL